MKVFLALLLVLGAVPAGAVGDEAPVYSPPPSPDIAPPETKIERSVLRIVTRTATFWFSSSEPAQGFYCQLDKGDFKPCGSPRAYKRLKPGGHAFRVKAVDAAGNVDGSAAVVHFKIPKASPHHR